MIGRVTDILISPDNSKAIAILDRFEVAAIRHPIWKMPYVTRRQQEVTYITVAVQVSE